MDDHTAVGPVQCLYSQPGSQAAVQPYIQGNTGEIPVYTGESRVYTLYTAVQRYIRLYSRYSRYSQIGYIGCLSTACTQRSERLYSGIYGAPRPLYRAVPPLYPSKDPVVERLRQPDRLYRLYSRCTTVYTGNTAI